MAPAHFILAVPAQAVEEAVKEIVSTGDKLGIVAILLLILCAIVVGFARGYFPDPASLARERDDCKKKGELLDALTKEAQDGAVNYAVSKVTMEYQTKELERCEQRIRELESMRVPHLPGINPADAV